ncbi:MAG: glycosyltransferase family 4 protein [Candidatus Doudnabacteria bacterium]|nr:glycosyltransferase family 4 protein [Candidatus Doudnabacteria bacterium]
MKICFIAPKAYPVFVPETDATFGGAEMQLSLFAKELASRDGLETFVFVGDYGQSETVRVGDVWLYKCLKAEASLVARVKQFYQCMKRHPADVYIQRALSPFSGVIGILAQRQGAQFVYMVANNGETDGDHPAYRFPVLRWLSLQTFSRADAVIAQNDYQKLQLQKRGWAGTTDVTRIRSVAQLAEEIADFSSREGVLWIGRCASLKQPEKGLQLAKELPTNAFRMACPPATGEEELFERVNEQVKQIKNISFQKRVPPSELDTAFSSAKVHVNTSSQEGFPSTFVEAAKNGTPIVSLHVNPDNVLHDYEFGIACNGDWELFKREVSDLTVNQERWESYSRNARMYARQEHDIVKNASLLLDQIEQKTA